MQNQRRKKESDLLKKTIKLPQKQPAKERSPNTQRTDSGLRTVKMDGYARVVLGRIDSSMMATNTNGYTKGRVRQNTSLDTQWTDFSLRAVKTYGNVESCAEYKEDS